MKNHWNSIWLRIPVTYGFTLHLKDGDHTRWFWRCVGTAFGHFLLVSRNFMVTAHVWSGSCVKYPSGIPEKLMPNPPPFLGYLCSSWPTNKATILTDLTWLFYHERVWTTPNSHDLDSITSIGVDICTEIWVTNSVWRSIFGVYHVHASWIYTRQRGIINKVGGC